MPNPQPIKILLVEDSPSDARLVQGILAEATGENFEVTWTDRLDTAHGKIARIPPSTSGLSTWGFPTAWARTPT